MKKLIMVLCILCSSLFFINPIEKLTYANDTNKIHQQTELTLEQAKAQIEEKNIEILNRTIMQMKIRKDSNRQ